MSIEIWEHFFKPEVRSSGRRYFTDGNVSVSQPSDTEIQAYIRVSPPLKVSLRSPSMASPLIVADCTCSAAKKGQLCKHIWATLLAVEEKRPDFFEDKSELEKEAKQSFSKQTPPKTQTAEAYKAKQNEYRKQQYQKQKQRLKDLKQSQKKGKTQASALPENVVAALAFFSDNGFPLENPPQMESIQMAKKKLSRIFHPDIGGTHKEFLELNKNTAVLLEFIESNKK